MEFAYNTTNVCGWGFESLYGDQIVKYNRMWRNLVASGLWSAEVRVQIPSSWLMLADVQWMHTWLWPKSLAGKAGSIPVSQPDFYSKHKLSLGRSSWKQSHCSVFLVQTVMVLDSFQFQLVIWTDLIFGVSVDTVTATWFQQVVDVTRELSLSEQEPMKFGREYEEGTAMVLNSLENCGP